MIQPYNIYIYRMSLNSVARKFRSSVKLVAKEVEKFKNRVSHDELILLSARCATSEIGKNNCFVFIDCIYIIYYLYTLKQHKYNNIVPLGGYLFEYFMFTASSYSQHRLWTQLCNNIDGNQAIDIERQHKFIKYNCNSFIGWLLFHIGNIGSNGGRQLFYTYLSRVHTSVCQGTVLKH
jgi:hypothetical protein